MHTTQLPAKRSRPVGICFRISAKFRRGICAAHSLPQRASEKRPSCTTEHRTCTHKTTFEYNHTNEIYAHRRLLAIKKKRSRRRKGVHKSETTHEYGSAIARSLALHTRAWSILKGKCFYPGRVVLHILSGFTFRRIQPGRRFVAWRVFRIIAMLIDCT